MQLHLESLLYHKNMQCEIFDQFEHKADIMKLTHPMVYPSIIKDIKTNTIYLFYRWFGGNTFEMYTSTDGIKFKKRNNYKLEYGSCTHNLTFFHILRKNSSQS